MKKNYVFISRIDTPATCDKFDDIQLFSHFWPSISHIRWKLSNRKLWPLSQQHIMLVKRENIGMTYACIKIQTKTTLAIYLLKRLYFSFHPPPCSQLCIYRYPWYLADTIVWISTIYIYIVIYSKKLLPNYVFYKIDFW